MKTISPFVTMFSKFVCCRGIRKRLYVGRVWQLLAYYPSVDDFENILAKLWNLILCHIVFKTVCCRYAGWKWSTWYIKLLDLNLKDSTLPSRCNMQLAVFLWTDVGVYWLDTCFYLPINTRMWGIYKVSLVLDGRFVR